MYDPWCFGSKIRLNNCFSRKQHYSKFFWLRFFVLWWALETRLWNWLSNFLSCLDPYEVACLHHRQPFGSMVSQCQWYELRSLFHLKLLSRKSFHEELQEVISFWSLLNQSQPSWIRHVVSHATPHVVDFHIQILFHVSIQVKHLSLSPTFLVHYSTFCENQLKKKNVPC